jgi:hypothetical protein
LEKDRSGVQSTRRKTIHTRVKLALQQLRDHAPLPTYIILFPLEDAIDVRPDQTA